MKYAFLALFLLPLSAQASEPQPPLTDAQKQESFATGQRMAECAGFYRYSALLPEVTSKAALAKQLNNKADDWEQAATYFILNGSTRQGQYEVKETVDGLVKDKKTEYLAHAETAGANAAAEIRDSFEKGCAPLLQLQEKTLQVMRQGAAK